jgi:hypothetical protein
VLSVLFSAAGVSLFVRVKKVKVFLYKPGMAVDVPGG